MFADAAGTVVVSPIQKIGLAGQASKSPERNERCFSSGDRRTIAKAFGRDIKNLTQFELDNVLYEIRKEQIDKYGTEELDFYNDPLWNLWAEKNQVKEESPEYSVGENSRREQFKAWLEEKYTKSQSNVIMSYLRALQLLEGAIGNSVYSYESKNGDRPHFRVKSCVT